MSRPSSVSSARNLSLTEELEKLEQSITLTLQEIDHNFSRAHRIVTGSILPVVEQYAKHSEAVWEGSRFWKQFFEASANVSLSGYEEAQQDQSILERDDTEQTATETTTTDATETTTTQDETAIDYEGDEDPTVRGVEDSTATMTPPTATKHSSHFDVEDSLLSSPSGAGAHSTPRMPPSVGKRPTPFSEVTKTLRAAQIDTSDMPSTPRTQQDVVASSPFELPSTIRKSTHKDPQNDPLLHRMLDKTYRIAATPHRTRDPPPSILRSGKRTAATPATANKTTRWQLDDSPMSSPEIQAPQLRAEIFNTPGKGTPGKGRPVLNAGKRTPGVSVQTPGKTWGGRFTNTGANNLDDETRRTLWDDEDSDEDLGFSPPKTMQFHIPQGKLLQTPAREASKQIVEDLLRTAGGDFTEDDQTEDSPSVIRRGLDADDTF